MQSMIIFTVCTHDPYAVTKCYFMRKSHTIKWHTFNQLLWQH